jgi:hypothetical protein
MSGLRAKQKHDRNNRILEAAAELFKHSGYDAVKMEAIAEASEVSIGTIYNYYQNKGDLLVAIVSMEVHEVLRAGAGIVAKPPLNAYDAIDSLVGIYYSHSLVYLSKEMWRVAMSISTQQPSSPFGLSYSELDSALADQTCALIRKLQKLGLVRADCDVAAIGEIIFNNLNMMFISFVKDDTMTLSKLRKNLRKQIRALVSMIALT